MNIVHPINFLGGLGWCDLQIDHDRFLAAADEHTAQRFLAAGVIPWCGFEGDPLGEQNRIDVDINLALRRVLTAFSGYSSSLLFVDEPWRGIDQSGKANVYQLLETEAKDCLVLATDRDKSSKPFAEARVWTVRKGDKVSALSL